MQHELLVPLVLLEELLVELVLLPLGEALGLVLARATPSLGNPVLGRFIVFLYSFATWTTSISRAQKSARPSCWDEALVSHFACDHPASGSSA
jgi:hypothetical protein